MIRHIFIGPSFPHCTDTQLLEVTELLSTLTDIVPWIRQLSVKASLSTSDIKSVVLVAEFDSQSDWERYMHEPNHIALGGRINHIIDFSKMVVVQTNC